MSGGRSDFNSIRELLRLVHCHVCMRLLELVGWLSSAT